MQNLWILLLSFLFASQIVIAQKIETNKSGEKIIVFEDGTWRPIQDSDSLLIRKIEKPFLETDDSGIDIFEYPDENLKSINKRKSKKKEPQQKNIELTRKIEDLQNKYDKFSKDPSIPESDLNIIEQEIIMLQKELAASELSKNTSKVVASVDVKQENYMLATSFRKPVNLHENPPIPACSFKYINRDKVDGKRRSETVSNHWFSFTNPNLYSVFPDREFLSVNASITEISPYKFLNIDFNFNTITAKREYGALISGASLTIIFTNGDFISLQNTSHSEGIVDGKNNITSYNGIFPLSSKDEKKLSKQPIDKIRVVWSSGFEDYEIFHVDVLMNQLNCIYNLN